jgi:hypothetical protein
LFCFCSARDWIQGLMRTRQVLYSDLHPHSYFYYFPPPSLPSYLFGCFGSPNWLKLLMLLPLPPKFWDYRTPLATLTTLTQHNTRSSIQGNTAIKRNETYILEGKK